MVRGPVLDSAEFSRGASAAALCRPLAVILVVVLGLLAAGDVAPVFAVYSDAADHTDLWVRSCLARAPSEILACVCKKCGAISKT